MPSYLKTNESLRNGQPLVSNNRQFQAVVGHTGNLQILWTPPGWAWDPIANWNSRPGFGSGVPADVYLLTMQGDGNLCCNLADRAGKPISPPVWQSGVAPGKGDYFAIMQDDGNLVVYKGADPEHNLGYVWCTGTLMAPSARTIVLHSLVSSKDSGSQPPFALAAVPPEGESAGSTHLSIRNRDSADPAQRWQRYDRHLGGQWVGWLYRNQKSGLFLSGAGAKGQPADQIRDLDRAGWRPEEYDPPGHALQPTCNLGQRLNVAGDGPHFTAGTVVCLWPWSGRTHEWNTLWTIDEIS